MNEWAEMRLNGFLGFIHKCVMFLTWPLRHWKILLSILLLLIVLFFTVPFFYGVKWNEIVDWYKVKYSESWLAGLTSGVSKVATDTVKKSEKTIQIIKEKAVKISPEAETEQTAKQKNVPVRFVTWNVEKFTKSKYHPQKSSKKIKLKAPTFAKIEPYSEQNIPLSQNTEAKSESFAPYYDGNLSDYYTIRRDLDLVYLSESEKLYGKVDIIDANSLYIDNTFVYLYGIFTNPNNYDEQAAQLFLEKLTEGRNLHCDIVAYTTQSQAATALCFLDGKLINQQLVDAELAENVALK